MAKAATKTSSNEDQARDGDGRFVKDAAGKSGGAKKGASDAGDAKKANASDRGSKSK